MDVETAIELAQQIKELLDSLPKDEVVLERRGQVQVFTLTFSLERQEVILQVVLGSRGGLRKFIYVIDSSIPVLADQVILSAEISIFPMAIELLELEELRNKIRQDGTDRDKLCRHALMETMRRAKQDRADFDAIVKRISSERSESVRTLSGGLPNLGRRHS